MNLNQTPSGERVHIGFFGMRNAGKSSLVNAVTGQALSVVSQVKGTTTDPVKKAMELLPLGPVVIIDTPGMDDDGALGEKRVEKAFQALAHTDLAILVVDATCGMREDDRRLEALLRERSIPYLIAYNKADMLSARPPLPENAFYVSALTGENIPLLKEHLGAFVLPAEQQRVIVSDLLQKGDRAVLVIPVDESAPKGRLILPQQQTMRELLDSHCAFAACQPEELAATLEALQAPPRLVITDSQVFGRVAEIVPKEVALTSFSILFARYKGDLPTLVSGAVALSRLKEGDRVLISEGCTHHRQCNDIGSVKLPGWIERYTGVKPQFSFTSGGEFPNDLSGYALVVHCGGCMLNQREMRHRMGQASAARVPIVNYGVAIAMMHGILPRCLSPFPQLEKQLMENA